MVRWVKNTCCKGEMRNAKMLSRMAMTTKFEKKRFLRGDMICFHDSGLVQAYNAVNTYAKVEV